MSAINCLAIDGDDTLWFCRHNYFLAEWTCGKILNDALGVQALPPQDILHHQKQIERAAMKSHGYQVTQFEDAWVAAYRQLARQAVCPFRSKVADEIFQAAGYIRRAAYPVFPEARQVLVAVKALVRSVHLISLGDHRFQMEKLERSGLADLFDSIHITQESKSLVLQKLAKSEPAMAMVGDSLHTDIDPAIALGMTGIWIHNTVPWAQSENGLDPRAHVIYHLTELPDLLRKLI